MTVQTRRILFLWLTFGLSGVWRARRLRRLRQLRRHPARLARFRRYRAPEDEQGFDRRQAMAGAVAGAIGMAGLTASTPAHAISAGAIANVVTSKMKGMLSGLLGTLFQMLTQMFSQQTDKSIGAIGKTGDAINTQATDIENRRILRETEPPPDACRSAQLGNDGQIASDISSIKTVEDDLTLAKIYNGSTVDEAITNRRKRVSMRQKKFGPASPTPWADTTASIFEKTQLDDGDHDTVNSFIENALGESRHNAPALPPSLQGRESSVLYSDVSATYQARRSIAQKPLLSAKNRRINPTKGVNGSAGQSEQDVLYEEVRRTWGNADWRAEVDKYAAPTPLLKEQVKLTAFQNKLLLKQLEALEEGNLVLSSLLLESLDSEEWRDRLNKAYVAANADSDPIG